MIGRKEWFERRTFGWGLQAATWQGWVYGLVFIVVLLLLLHLPDFWYFSAATRAPLVLIWITIIMADVLHIWISLKGK